MARKFERVETAPRRLLIPTMNLAPPRRIAVEHFQFANSVASTASVGPTPTKKSLLAVCVR